jgi:CBS-domain-containing membrane protein
MRVQDIMTTDVVSIAPDASIADALDLMTNSRVSGLPVVDAARHLVGIVSEADFLRRLELGTAGPSASWLTQFLLPGRAAEVFTRARAYRVDEVMRVNVVTIDEEATLAEAVALMERESVKRLPVIADGKLAGILTRADFVRALAKLARRKYPVNAISDDEIRHRVRAEMRAQPWGPVATVDVAVKDGVVSLRGILTDERVRTAMHALTEGVYGVAAIEDHMRRAAIRSRCMIWRRRMSRRF